MRLSGCVIAALVLAAPLSAQLPKDVIRVFDTFTEDTIYSTKYGRLDSPQRCGRTDISLVWQLARGKLGEREWLVYNWIMMDMPFSRKAHWLNAVQAVLSIDGDFVELEKHPLTPQLGGNGRDEYKEQGQFQLPPGTFARVIHAQNVKVRFAGTEMTCDGTMEPNMIIRLKSLLEYARNAEV